MADETARNSVGSFERKEPTGGHEVEKSPVEARQGFRDRPVLYVLGASLTLAVIAYVILHLYYFGSPF
jgi:hypothetical protein